MNIIPSRIGDQYILSTKLGQDKEVQHTLGSVNWGIDNP